MRARQLRIVAVLAVIAVAAVAHFSGGHRAQASRINVHGDPHLSADHMTRLLNATTAASTATPNAELIAAGRTLFRSNTLSKTGESCQTCHTEGARHAQLGTFHHPLADTPGDFTGPRIPPALWGVDRTAPYGWIADVPTLNAFVVRTIHRLFKAGATQPDATTAGQAAALIAFISSLRPPRTSFDNGTMSAAARRGIRVFQTKGRCISCHGGADFTDTRLHATLVPKTSPSDTDPGAAPGFPGAFNTPQLRDLKNIAPFMHNGSLKTLQDVVTFYDQTSVIAPLKLTPGEQADLVAFLESL
jgi:cytochrome c peroxidase